MKIKKIIISLIACFYFYSLIYAKQDNKEDNLKIFDEYTESDPCKKNLLEICIKFSYDLKNANKFTSLCLKDIMFDAFRNFLIYDCFLNYDMNMVDGDGNNIEKKFKENVVGIPITEIEKGNLTKEQKEKLDEEMNKLQKYKEISHKLCYKHTGFNNLDETTIVVNEKNLEELDKCDFTKISAYIYKIRNKNFNLNGFVKCFINALNNYIGNFFRKICDDKEMQKVANIFKIGFEEVKQGIEVLKNLNQAEKWDLATAIAKSHITTFSGSIIDNAAATATDENPSKKNICISFNNNLKDATYYAKFCIREILFDTLKTFFLYDCLLGYDMENVDRDGKHLKQKFIEKVTGKTDLYIKMNELTEEQKQIINKKNDYEKLLRKVKTGLYFPVDINKDGCNKLTIEIPDDIFKKLFKDNQQIIKNYININKDNNASDELFKYLERSKNKFLKCFMFELNASNGDIGQFSEEGLEKGNEEDIQIDSNIRAVARNQALPNEEVKKTFKYLDSLSQQQKEDLAKEMQLASYTFFKSILDLIDKT